MKRTRNLVVLLQSGAASENLGEPELANSALHVSNLALSRRGGLDPLRRLPANTADHVGMGKRLGSALLRLDVEGRRDGLGDAGVKRRSAARDDQAVVALITGAWSSIAVAGARASKGRVGVQGRRHFDFGATFGSRGLPVNDGGCCRGGENGASQDPFN